MGDKEKSMIGANLKFLRKERNMTQEELAQELGIGRHSVGSYEEGRAEPKIETLFAICELFSIPAKAFVQSDLADLSAMEIEALRGEFKVDVEGKGLRVLQVVVDKTGRENIPMVNVKAAAGYLNGYGDEEYIETLPTFNLPLPSFDRGTYRAFEIKGDSMLPIKPGSIVIGEFVENWRDVKDDEVYIVVSISEGVVLKRVKNRVNRDGQSGYFTLKSDNPAFSNMEVAVEDIKEFWKAKAYISQSFPDPDLSLERISAIVLELQQEMIRMKR